MLLVPFARALDALVIHALRSLNAYPRTATLANEALARWRLAQRRRRNRAAVGRMYAMDDAQLRDVGVNRIAVARAALAPRRCDAVAVLRREAELD